MESQPLYTSEEKKRPGPKPKANAEIESLKARIDQLEQILIKVSTHTGYAAVLREHGLAPYNPNRKDMHRYA